jgi:threonylcarbamoyladenosine tRNA methylthiotransferase MtaB
LCSLINLGCKLNQYEGYCLQKHLDDDNTIVVNTCCVTAQATQTSRKKFRRALREHPNHKVIATGCACKLYPEEYKTAHGIISLEERDRIISDVFPLPSRSRYFLKIQDGCIESCTYCIVCVIRNHLSSKSVDRILSEVDWARSHAYREIVLVGANIGLYGIDRSESLLHLLRELQNVRDLPRIRLSSIEPRFISGELISTMQGLPLCRHFHVPIQSGDDTILGKMGRTYTRGELHGNITKLAKAFSGTAIGIDVIVGFPGEDNERFQHTKQLVDDLPITHAHIFPYSPRPHTHAYKLGDPVSAAEKKVRLHELRRLVVSKNFVFRQSLLGQMVEVIIIQSYPKCVGLSDTYIRVELDRTLPKGTIAQATITGVTLSHTRGALVQTRSSV